MTRKIFYLISFLAVFILTGCNQNRVSINNQISDPHVIVENPSLHKWLQLERVNYFERKDGLMEVEVKFRNFSDYNQLLSYRINWLDENGFVQKSILSRWVVSEVEERRSLVIHGIAPSIKVKSFEIRLQEPTKDDNLRRDSYHYEYQGN